MKIKDEKFFDLVDLGYKAIDTEDGRTLAAKFFGDSYAIYVDFLTKEITLYRGGIFFKADSDLCTYMKGLKKLWKLGFIE